MSIRFPLVVLGVSLVILGLVSVVCDAGDDFRHTGFAFFASVRLAVGIRGGLRAIFFGPE